MPQMHAHRDNRTRQRMARLNFVATFYTAHARDIGEHVGLFRKNLAGRAAVSAISGRTVPDVAFTEGACSTGNRHGDDKERAKAQSS